jgi:hypothetical protein
MALVAERRAPLRGFERTAASAEDAEMCVCKVFVYIFVVVVVVVVDRGSSRCEDLLLIFSCALLNLRFASSQNHR